MGGPATGSSSSGGSGAGKKQQPRVIPAGQGGTAIRVLATAWGYAAMLSSFIVAFTLQVVVSAALYPFTSAKDRLMVVGWIFRYVSSHVIKLNPFWHLRVLGPRPKEGPANTLVMCNHLSNADAFFLCSALLPWETKYIAKADLFKVPFGGWAMWLAGDLPVHFTRDHTGWGVKKGTVGKMMEQCRAYLQEGIPVAVFPEGGRSEDGRLRPLKDGFFGLALQTGTEILPCAISGTEQAWPIYEALMGPATVYVRIGNPISPKGHTLESLKIAVRDAILGLQNNLPTPLTVPPEFRNPNGTVIPNLGEAQSYRQQQQQQHMRQQAASH